MGQTGFHHYEADSPRVLTANTPSFATATGFQDRVAKAAKNQGPYYESGCVIFDEKGVRLMATADSLAKMVSKFPLLFPRPRHSAPPSASNHYPFASPALSGWIVQHVAR